MLYNIQHPNAVKTYEHPNVKQAPAPEPEPAPAPAPMLTSGVPLQIPSSFSSGVVQSNASNAAQSQPTTDPMLLLTPEQRAYRINQIGNRIRNKAVAGAVGKP